MKTDKVVTPTISRVIDDDTLIELVYDPAAQTTGLAIRRPDGSTSLEASFETASAERLVPYSAHNNLIVSGCILLPSQIGPFESKEALLADVRAFIHQYVDLSPALEAIAAHYVLLSWVYDAFNELPYLRFRGDFGTGKTRALLTIGSLCNKAFFASGASTVSPIFHIQDAFQGTLVLDEADFRFSDVTAQLAKVLNNGTTRGMPVLRTMTNRNRELNPQAFRVFGPKIIAMREQFADPALESRFLTAETNGRTVRSDVPIHLPPEFNSEALRLRDSLLAWRFRSRFSIGPDPARAAMGVGPRYRQTSLALLSLVDSADVRSEIGRELAAEEARGFHERADTLEAAMLTAVLDTFRSTDLAHAPVGEIARRFNALTSDELGKAMTNKWVGGFLRTRLRLATIKTSGVFAVPRDELQRVQVLAERFGVREAA